MGLIVKVIDYFIIIFTYSHNISAVYAWKPITTEIFKILLETMQQMQLNQESESQFANNYNYFELHCYCEGTDWFRFIFPGKFNLGKDLSFFIVEIT